MMSTREQPRPPATPVLVVGPIRSGTKWLSNILCNHPDIAGVQTERSGGILETNMFHRMPAKFDLRYADEYVGCVEVWSRTQFFRETEEDKGFFYSLEPRPISHVTLFRLLMERYAARVGCGHWLQKVGPSSLLGIVGELAGAKLVTITRDPIDSLRSRAQMNRNRGAELSTYKALPQVVRDYRLLERVQAEHGAFPVRYEALRADPQGTIRAVCEHLGVDFDQGMLDVPYRPNTSFRHNESREAGLDAGAERRLRWAVALLESTPLPLLDRFVDWLVRRQPGRRRFVPGTFGDLKADLADRQDYDGSVAAAPDRAADRRPVL